MRKIWTMALAACLLSMGTIAGARAQQDSSAPADMSDEEATPNAKSGHAGNGENRLENLSKQLNLSEEQKSKIGPILKHEVERIREVRSNSSLTQGEARRRIARIRRNSNQQIAQFLTPDQKKQWQEMREERHGHGGPEGDQGGPGSGKPNGPPAPQNPPNPQ